MVRVARAQLESKNPDKTNKLQIVIESQQCLFDAISGIVSSFNSITYRLSCGSSVKIYNEDGKTFSLRFKDYKSTSRETELYELYFPFPSEEEEDFSYQLRLLSGIESFIDELAKGQIISLDHT